MTGTNDLTIGTTTNFGAGQMYGSLGFNPPIPAASGVSLAHPGTELPSEQGQQGVVGDVAAAPSTLSAPQQTCLSATTQAPITCPPGTPTALDSGGGSSVQHDGGAADAPAYDLCYPARSPCGTYDGHRAAQYAYLQAKAGEEAADKGDVSFHNRSWPFFGTGLDDGEDCTNFASQAIWLGGVHYMRTEHHVDWPNEAYAPDGLDDYQTGTDSWWAAYLLRKYSNVHGPYYLRDFANTDSWPAAQNNFDELTQTGIGEVLNFNQPLEPGDLLYYKTNGATNYNHVQIVVSAGDHDALVAQHSRSYVHSLAWVIKNDLIPAKGVDSYTITAVRPVYAMADIAH